jgi:ADP-heptose:LPS heptosyltransferase
MSPRWLVIHPGAVGDVLLALPALAHLATLVPGVHRLLAVGPGPAALLAGTPYAEAATRLDDLGLHRLFVADPAEESPPGLAPFDGVVSWLGAGDPTYRARLARWARGRRPAPQPDRRAVVARATPPPGSGRHASRHLLETLAPLGPVPATLRPAPLPVPATERAWATAWLGGRGLGRGQVVLVHPGAGSPSKVWPGHHALVRALVAAGVSVVLSTGPAESAGAGGGDLAGLPAVHGARDLTLPRLAALLEAAGAFVGNDSGPSHLAVAVGCPAVVLFGPTDPAVWAPGGPPGTCPGVRVLRGAGEAPDPWRGLTVDGVAAAVLAAMVPPAASPWRGPEAVLR